MSALPHLPKDAPPVSTSEPNAAAEIAVSHNQDRHGSVSLSIVDDDKKSAGDGSNSPSSNGNAESLIDDASAPLSRTHVFQDEKIAEHWRQLYERTSYENRHRFDPNFEWTSAEEKKVLRKIDTRVLVWSWVMFMSLDLIRRNINRALADHFLGDLNMNQDDFNNGQHGVSSQLVKLLSRTRLASSFAELCKELPKISFLPDQILYLSYYYTGKELSTRLSYFYTVLGTSQILGSFLAAGFVQLRGLNGLAGWRYLFGFEGLITGVIGIISFFMLAPSPTNTAGILRGKNGWFNEREEKILVNRVLRDDPTKGDMNNREGVSLKGLWAAIREKDLWPVYMLGLVVFQSYNPPQMYLSLILKQLKFSTLQSNLLAIPSQFFFTLNTVPYAWLSARLNERGILASLSNVWTLAFLIPLYLLKHSMEDKYNWIRYGLITALTSVPYCHAFLIGWVSQNSQSVRNRAVSLCLYNMSVQVGSVLATRIYTAGEKPYYAKGNLALISLACLSIVLCWLAKLYYIGRNKQKKQAWDALSSDEQLQYKLNTKDEGSKRLDVLFVH
ncbi:hypothetical protein NDA11_003069 [Ustilago hordei]|nr:hypothetical protein NDA15_000709 [Ustilago hordei]KAJ1592914.1 hypothetical protein NDA11_003069 [Ustilago hordei]